MQGTSAIRVVTIVILIILAGLLGVYTGHLISEYYSEEEEVEYDVIYLPPKYDNATCTLTAGVPNQHYTYNETNSLTNVEVSFPYYLNCDDGLQDTQYSIVNYSAKFLYTLDGGTPGSNDKYYLMKPLQRHAVFSAENSNLNSDEQSSGLDFYPHEIVTTYEYRLGDANTGSISYIILKNYGKADDVTVNVSFEHFVDGSWVSSEYSTVFFMAKNEEVKVTVQLPPDVKRPTGMTKSSGEFEFIDDFSETWEVRYAEDGDEMHTQMSVERLANSSGEDGGTEEADTESESRDFGDLLLISGLITALALIVIIIVSQLVALLKPKKEEADEEGAEKKEKGSRRKRNR
ncbi:MAG: hypothetical protein JSV49_00930 [Thermoplasmata archaeon]|nr:MAG: hypothetical protein JSV49_00930 [Thermoplasmata archaeon]